jgi:hypothetical protein
METTAPILGPILFVIGFTIILASAGVLFYSLWPRAKRQ